MVRIHLKGVNTAKKRLADGSIKKYYYHRGTKKRIMGEPGTPEFVASYAEAAKQEPTDIGTFSSLITGFLKSPEYGNLAPKTRSDYRVYLDIIRDKFGTMPIEALEDYRVRSDFFEWRDQYANQPRKADYAWSILRRVLSWAYDRGKLKVNHAINPGRLYVSDRSDKIWLPEHVDAFCKVAPYELQAAMVLAAYTGQRREDLVRMTWGQYNGGTIQLRQSKTDRKIEIPVHKDLKTALDCMTRKQAVILTSVTGKPWTKDNLSHQWRKATLKAKLDGLHFHDLRGTALTMLAEAGCTTPEIAAISGHSQRYIEEILDKYLARTQHLAKAAITKLENVGRTDFANRLQTAPVSDSRNKSEHPKNSTMSKG